MLFVLFYTCWILTVIGTDVTYTLGLNTLAINTFIFLFNDVNALWLIIYTLTGSPYTYDFISRHLRVSVIACTYRSSNES